jgi:hypothetical protein
VFAKNLQKFAKSAKMLAKIGKYVCKNLATRLEKCSKKFAIIGKNVCEKLAKCP